MDKVEKEEAKWEEYQRAKAILYSAEQEYHIASKRAYEAKQAWLAAMAPKDKD